MMIINKFGIILVILLLSTMNLTANFTGTPLSFYFEENGDKNKIIQFKHTRTESSFPVPVEISIFKRIIDINGKLEVKKGESDEDFIVFPSQIILYPGELQNVQVQWIGKNFPEKQTAYVLRAKQVSLPLEVPEESKTKAMGAVQVEMEYRGYILLNPSNMKPKVKIVSANPKEDTSGEKILEILFVNKGTEKKRLENFNLKIKYLDDKENENEKNYSPVLSKKITQESLFPGFKRKISLPWPDGIPFGRISSIEIEFK